MHLGTIFKSDCSIRSTVEGVSRGTHQCVRTVIHFKGLINFDYQPLSRCVCGFFSVGKGFLIKLVSCNLGVRQDQACIPALPFTP